ncbi:hypothetical protein [Nocardia cyriacigeorgica]|nr:hypothetical protein [Nocardia cyriacigeorgica]
MATKIMNGLDLQAQRIQNVADPSAPMDAVNLQTLEARQAGLSWKQAVRAASTANITVATPGAAIDGVSLSNGDRVLLKNQITTAENGIYVWAGASAALTRAADADDDGEIVDGTAVYVAEGTTNGDTAWVQTAPNPIDIGTDPTVWSQFGGGGASYTAGNGIDITGNSISVELAPSSGLSVSGAGLAVDTGVVVRKYAANIGNGSLTSIPVAHNLGTRDVTVQVYDNATFERVVPDIVHTDANTITAVFAVAPAANAYRVVVHG